MQRSFVLESAQQLTTQSRNKQHGDANGTFDLAGKFVDLYMEYSNKRFCPAHEDAIRMVLHKIARVACGQVNPDNYIDIAGYTGIACEMITETRQMEAADGECERRER